MSAISSVCRTSFRTACPCVPAYWRSRPGRWSGRTGQEPPVARRSAHRRSRGRQREVSKDVHRWTMRFDRACRRRRSIRLPLEISRGCRRPAHLAQLGLDLTPQRRGQLAGLTGLTPYRLACLSLRFRLLEPIAALTPIAAHLSAHRALAYAQNFGDAFLGWPHACSAHKSGSDPHTLSAGSFARGARCALPRLGSQVNAAPPAMNCCRVYGSAMPSTTITGSKNARHPSLVGCSRNQ
jgi:hypothetical protein